MSTLRRRLHHNDVDGKHREIFEASSLEGLGEPLLGSDRSYDTGSTLEEIWDDEKKKAGMHWTFVFSQLLAQWTQWIANFVIGSGSVIGKMFPLPFTNSNGSNQKYFQLSLSPLQEERLEVLQQRLGIPFDGSHPEHQDALRLLWQLAYPERELPGLISVQWKDMGWQGSDPSTDFRGGGFISLENLIFFANRYPESFQRLLHKKEGTRAEWEYPFAVAGVNISFMLAQMLDLQTGKPSTPAAVRFLEFLAKDEAAFDNLFCVAFQMMDAQWLAKRASYMEFNAVLQSTRAQLERELILEDVTTVKDLPAYNLLRG